VKPVGTVLVKHASPLTPQVPDPYPIGFEEVLSYPNVAACDARVALLALLGSDRLASRNEIRKLTLYAMGKKSIEVTDVMAVVADASQIALDGVVDAVFAGRAGEVDAEFGKARASGSLVQMGE